MADQRPVRRCAPCDRNWPNHSDYNLCPRCQRCTYATTDDAFPDHHEAKRDAARFKAYRDFDAQCDAGTLPHQLEFAAAMAEALPADPAPMNFGLAGPNFHGGKPPTDADVRGWQGDDA